MIRGILLLAHFTGWQITEIDDLALTEFFDFLAHANDLAKTSIR